MKKSSKKELDSATHVIKKGKEKDKSISILIDKAGNECDYLPIDQIVAQFTDDTRTKKYLVKFNIENELYDPNSREHIDRSYLIANKAGISPYTFRSVSKEFYDLYLTYLRTKKKEYFHQTLKGL